MIPFGEGAGSPQNLLSSHSPFLSPEPTSLSVFNKLLKYLPPSKRAFRVLWRMVLLTCTKKLFKVALSEEGEGAKDGDFGRSKAPGDVVDEKGTLERRMGEF